MNRGKKALIKDKSNIRCEKCRCVLTEDTATLDHIIPNIVILASGGKLKQSYKNFRIMCGQCNNNEIVPNLLGIVFKHTDPEVVLRASRKLCNLVRHKNAISY